MTSAIAGAGVGRPAVHDFSGHDDHQLLGEVRHRAMTKRSGDALTDTTVAATTMATSSGRTAPSATCCRSPKTKVPGRSSVTPSRADATAHRLLLHHRRRPTRQAGNRRLRPVGDPRLPAQMNHFDWYEAGGPGRRAGPRCFGIRFSRRAGSPTPRCRGWSAGRRRRARACPRAGCWRGCGRPSSGRSPRSPRR